MNIIESCVKRLCALIKKFDNTEYKIPISPQYQHHKLSSLSSTHTTVNDIKKIIMYLHQVMTGTTLSDDTTFISFHMPDTSVKVSSVGESKN